MEQEIVEISKEEFSAWKDNKVTRAVMQELVAQQQEMIMYLARGATIAKDADESTDLIVGRIQGLAKCLDVEYDERQEYGH